MLSEASLTAVRMPEPTTERRQPSWNYYLGLPSSDEESEDDHDTLNPQIYALTSYVQYNDPDYMTTRETFDAYKRDPERLKRKHDEKVQRQREREAAKRRRLASMTASSSYLEDQDIELQQARAQIQALERQLRDQKMLNESSLVERSLMREAVSRDWLLHNGNIHYCRDRSLFATYTSISATATMADRNQEVSVLGIGKVNLDLQRQIGPSNSELELEIYALHIPSARCNALSTPRIEKVYGRKDRDDNRTVFWERGTNAACFFANRSSGRLRLVMAGDSHGSDRDNQARHLLCNAPISISADRQRIAKEAPNVRFPVD